MFTKYQQKESSTYLFQKIGWAELYVVNAFYFHFYHYYVGYNYRDRGTHCCSQFLFVIFITIHYNVSNVITSSGHKLVLSDKVSSLTNHSPMAMALSAGTLSTLKLHQMTLAVYQLLNLVPWWNLRTQMNWPHTSSSSLLKVIKWWLDVWITDM